MLIEGRD